MRFIFVVSSFVLAALIPASLFAQTTMQDTLPNIDVEALRLSSVSSQSAPIALSVLSRSTTERALSPALSLDETLRELPGLWINDRANAAVGERISIRGMGWRSAFGVRGVQVIMDGIPLTMPDGQAFADIVAPSTIQRAELIRGPASLFWGNASGGVVYLSTELPAGAPTARLRYQGGSDGLQLLDAEGRTRIGTNQFHLAVSNDSRDGYRDYSNSRFTRATFHGTLPLSNQTIVRVMGALADQDAENPGSLTLEQFNENPRLANTRNVDTRAGKQSFQGQLGVSVLHETAIGEFSATTYGIIRDLDNPLSFAYIDLNRVAGGLRLALENDYGRLDWGIGMDLGGQKDDRINRNNDDGNPGDQLSLAQDEMVRNTAGYAFVNAHLTDALSATAGLRVDGVRFEMDDRLLENGDQSGEQTFSAWSPAIGLAYSLPGALIYTNFRNAFETPTTTELVNRPDLDGGFNPDIEPQHVSSLELGIRGATSSGKFSYDVALYTMEITDKLTPFQTEAGGDRTFYRNSGRNVHRGIELAFDMKPVPSLAMRFVRTSNAFEFRDDELASNRLPGIPDHRTTLSATYTRGAVFVQSILEHASSYFVNDANTQKNDGYAIVDVLFGYGGLNLKELSIAPFLRISNLFDENFSGSVIINAFGGRYYEPAPGRTIQAGINVAL